MAALGTQLPLWLWLGRAGAGAVTPLEVDLGYRAEALLWHYTAAGQPLHYRAAGLPLHYRSLVD